MAFPDALVSTVTPYAVIRVVLYVHMRSNGQFTEQLLIVHLTSRIKRVLRLWVK